MRCRHTVPDWHRYVVAGQDARPIFAACRLLIKEGERVADPQSIACTYWGRQPTCPVYDGPAVAARSPVSRPPNVTTGDLPTARESVWPVRAPGAPDVQRAVLIVLGALSIAGLGVAVLFSLAALSGMVASTSSWVIILLAGGLSLVTHLLALLRLWARR